MLPRSCFGLLRPHLNPVFALIAVKLESGTEVSDGCKSNNFAGTQKSWCSFCSYISRLELQFKLISALNSDGGLLF